LFPIRFRTRGPRWHLVRSRCRTIWTPPPPRSPRSRDSCPQLHAPRHRRPLEGSPAAQARPGTTRSEGALEQATPTVVQRSLALAQGWHNKGLLAAGKATRVEHQPLRASNRTTTGQEQQHQHNTTAAVGILARVLGQRPRDSSFSAGGAGGSRRSKPPGNRAGETRVLSRGPGNGPRSRQETRTTSQGRTKTRTTAFEQNEQSQNECGVGFCRDRFHPAQHCQCRSGCRESGPIRCEYYSIIV